MGIPYTPTGSSLSRSPGLNSCKNRLECLWYAMHADVEGLIKKLFCVRGAMKEFLEADRKDLPLKEYAQDEKLMKEWLQQTKEGGMMSPTCWYRALANGHQSETEKKLNGKVEKPYLFIGCDGDPVCRTDFIEQAKQEGLCPDLTVRELHSGHWCPYEKPDEVAKTIVEWLKEKGFLSR